MGIIVAKHSFLRIIGITFLALFITTTAVWLHFLYAPVVKDDQGVRYTLKPGSTVNTLIKDLSDQHIITHPQLFRLLVRLHDSAHKLKAGEYLFPKGSTPSSILNQIVLGKGLVYYPFTIISGWNIQQLRAALLQEGKLQHIVSTLSDEELMQHVMGQSIKPEGWFFPDTYYFTENSSDLALLKRAYDRMQDKLNQAWQTREAGLPFKDAYEALIAASLVEKEAYLDTERPMIAGVLINRLQANMLLQFDPTVIYGLGLQYTGKIQKTDLTQDTPFNTYVHKGLPPTPIAMPSFNSIQAVLHPSHHSYVYFVAKGDGSHQFSENLMDHHKAVSVARVVEMNKKVYFNEAVISKYLMTVMNEFAAKQAFKKNHQPVSISKSHTLHHHALKQKIASRHHKVTIKKHHQVA